MRFWLNAVAGYLVAGLAALLLAGVTSVLITLPLARPDDTTSNNAALGMLWFLLVLLQASLFVPLSLGVTAELVERKVQVRRFHWPKALWRSLIALPILVGPVYYFYFVDGYTSSARPERWGEKTAFLCCVSAAFAYRALRITKPPNSALRISISTPE